MQTILCLEKVVCDYIVNHFIRKLRDISLYLPDIQLHSASSELWNEQQFRQRDNSTKQKVQVFFIVKMTEIKD